MLWDENYFEKFLRRTVIDSGLGCLSSRSTHHPLQSDCLPRGITYRPCQWALVLPSFWLASANGELAGDGPLFKLSLANQNLSSGPLQVDCVPDLRSLLSRHLSLICIMATPPPLIRAQGEGSFAASSPGLPHDLCTLHQHTPTSL